eukprot:gene10539-7526_t
MIVWKWPFISPVESAIVGDLAFFQFVSLTLVSAGFAAGGGALFETAGTALLVTTIPIAVKALYDMALLLHDIHVARKRKGQAGRVLAAAPARAPAGRTTAADWGGIAPRPDGAVVPNGFAAAAASLTGALTLSPMVSKVGVIATLSCDVESAGAGEPIGW